MSIAPAEAGDAVATPNPPAEEAPHAFVRTFPCGGCGAKLVFAPGTRHLACEHCGKRNEFDDHDARIEELDLAIYLEALEGREETLEAETVKCARCGAEQEMPAHHFAAHCAFCSAPIVTKGYASRHIKPRSILPFQVPRRRAQDAFRRWVKGLWLAPKELQRYAQSDAAMTGIYLPFWTYDCRTESSYTGERGENYYTTESYTVVENGRNVTRTRQVKHTNWFPVSGRVAHFHDDVLVMASQSLPHSLRGAARGWNLDALVPYQPEFVSGYRAEAYQIGLAAGYEIARRDIDAHVNALIRRDIGGDEQRVRHVDTAYSDIRFKHVLLPVWISAYRFRDKTFRFLVNGQTGEVAGESPVSWFKVGWLVAAVIVSFLLLFLVLSYS